MSSPIFRDSTDLTWYPFFIKSSFENQLRQIDGLSISSKINFSKFTLKCYDWISCEIHVTLPNCEESPPDCHPQPITFLSIIFSQVLFQKAHAFVSVFGVDILATFSMINHQYRDKMSCLCLQSYGHCFGYCYFIVFFSLINVFLNWFLFSGARYPYSWYCTHSNNS